MFLVTGTSILDSTESPERRQHFKKGKIVQTGCVKKTIS